MTKPDSDVEERLESGVVNSNGSASAPKDIEPKWWKFIVKHWHQSSEVLAVLSILVMIWGIGLFMDIEYAKPSSPIARLFFMFVGAKLAGIVVTLIGIPDILGMIFFGVLFKNVGVADFGGYESLEAFLRELALVNIMLLAGLGLNYQELKKLMAMSLKLTFIPTIAEVAVITVLAYFLLNMPWLWGILLGLVITAVSPNVVISILLSLKEQKLGLEKGLHTVIIAMTGLNDVLAIFLFGVFLGVIFTTGPLVEQILQGPCGIGIGCVYGGLAGFFITLLPSNQALYNDILKFVLTVMAGIMAVQGSKYLGYPSGGALGCMTLAFTQGLIWRHKRVDNKVETYLDIFWKFMKPISFALIGKELDFSVMNGSTVGYGVVITVVGCIFRIFFAYISTTGGGYVWQERAYITLSSFPKATVQATIGPIALDLARQKESETDIELANSVLICSVVAILLTAPLGAILMEKLAPKWLKKCDNHERGVDNSAYITQ